MGAQLRNCPECGKLFAYEGRNVCRQCMQKEEDDYLLVRKYVRDHPGANVFEVADATGIDEEKILQFLKDGRLHSRGFSESLECERCGKRIPSGRFCQACLAQLNTEIKRAMPQKSKPEQDIPISKSNEQMYVKKTKKE